MYEWAMVDGPKPAPDQGLICSLDEAGSELSDLAAWLDTDARIRIYCEMQRIRVLDATMIALQRQGRISFYGSCTGQEAVPVGAAFGAESEDWVFPALRESAIMLVRGFPLARYLAQVFGSSDDILKGRQMPSHMSSRGVFQVSWSSCMGTQLCHAVGAAWAARLAGESRVMLAFMGDGATSSTDFHAALNFAGVYHTGTVFICQNNQWAISTPSSRQCAASTLAMRARAYGIAATRIDGNDALVVATAVREACRRARAGLGPSFVECVTYRMGAHSTSDDPSRYRTEEELAEWRGKDPLMRLRAHLEVGGYWDARRQRQLEAAIESEIATAVAIAERHGHPARESLFEDVYARMPWHLREQREILLAGPVATR